MKKPRAWLAASFIALGVGVHAPDLWAKGAPVETATKAQKADAQKSYAEGKQAFDDKQFEAALAKFRASYDIVASPNSHLMVARSLGELGRLGEAYDEYQGTVDEAMEANDPEKYGKTLESAKEERLALRAKLAFVTVDVDAEVTANGRPVRREAWGRPIAVAPGNVEVALKSKSAVLAEQKVDLPAGGDITMVLTPQVSSGPPAPAACPEVAVAPAAPAKTTGGTQRTMALVTGGIGVVGIGTYVAFALLNNSRYNDLKSRCPGNICPEAAASDVKQGNTYQTISFVGLGVGVVGVGTGLLLWFTSPKSQPAPQQGKRPELLIGASSVAVRGRF
jgi:hypothetical protein